MFKFLAKLNKWLLPSLTRNHADIANLGRFQKTLIAWRYYVTTRALKKS